MQYDYCPNCASLRLKRLSNSQEYKCMSCNYTGDIKRDSIDKINLYRKRLSNTNNSNPVNNTYLGKDNLNNSLKKPGLNRGENKLDLSLQEKLDNKFSNKKSGDWELL